MRQRIPLIIAIVIGLGGVFLLVAPFSHGVVLSAGTEQRYELPCESPLVDAFDDDTPAGWVNFSPDGHVTVHQGGRVSGGLCRSSSTFRLQAGGVLLAAGLVPAVILRRRSRSASFSGRNG